MIHRRMFCKILKYNSGKTIDNDDNIDNFSKYGHLSLMSLYHDRKCTDRSMSFAEKYNRIDILNWIFNNTLVCCHSSMMQNAVRNGHINVVKWIYCNFTYNVYINRMIQFNNNKKHQIRFDCRCLCTGCFYESIDDYYDEITSKYSIMIAIRYDRLDILRFLIENTDIAYNLNQLISLSESLKRNNITEYLKQLKKYVYKK